MSAVVHASAENTAQTAAVLRRDGVVILDSLWDASKVDQLRALVERQHPEFVDPSSLHDYLGKKKERVLAPVHITREMYDSGLLRSAPLDAICRVMLGEDYVYEAFGVIWVQPGAPAQKPHRDGGALFAESGLDRVLPPSAMTVAVPLVDVDLDLAPTGAAPGSHRLAQGAEVGELQPIELARGDAAIWDFRTFHGGLANLTDRPRPALYFTVCRPFWIDHLNFRKDARVRLVGEPEVLAELGPSFIRAIPA